MDKETVAYAYNGLLNSLRKEENPDTCDNMDEPYAKRNQPVQKG